MVRTSKLGVPGGTSENIGEDPHFEVQFIDFDWWVGQRMCIVE